MMLGGLCDENRGQRPGDTRQQWFSCPPQGPLGLSLPCVPPSILLPPSLMHTLTVCLLSFALQFSPELSQNSPAVDFSGNLYSLKFLVPLP